MDKQTKINLSQYKRLAAAIANDKQAAWMIRTCKDVGAARGIVRAHDRKTGWILEFSVKEP